VAFVRQAHEVLRRRLLERRRKALAGFGRPTGFVVTFAPDVAVRFDLAGNPVAVLARAHRVGGVELTLRVNS
jgi:hypothetical protein